MSAPQARLIVVPQTVRFCPHAMCSRLCGIDSCVCPPCSCWSCRQRTAKARRARPKLMDVRRVPAYLGRQPRLFHDIAGAKPLTRPRSGAATQINDKEDQMDKLYRQGDVLIRRVQEIPSSAATEVPKDDGRVILAYGEVTGHAHAVLGDVEFLATDLDEMNERFLRVESEASVVHEEHDTITLPPGNYEVRRQREYAPEAPVWVAD